MPSTTADINYLYFTYENMRERCDWNFDSRELVRTLSKATGFSEEVVSEEIERILSSPGHKAPSENNAVMQAEAYRRWGTSVKREFDQIKSLDKLEARVAEAAGKNLTEPERGPINLEPERAPTAPTYATPRPSQRRDSTVPATWIHPSTKTPFAPSALMQPVHYPANPSHSTPRQIGYTATPRAHSGPHSGPAANNSSRSRS